MKPITKQSAKEWFWNRLKFWAEILAAGGILLTCAKVAFDEKSIYRTVEIASTQDTDSLFNLMTRIDKALVRIEKKTDENALRTKYNAIGTFALSGNFTQAQLIRMLSDLEKNQINTDTLLTELVIDKVAEGNSRKRALQNDEAGERFRGTHH